MSVVKPDTKSLTFRPLQEEKSARVLVDQLRVPALQLE